MGHCVTCECDIWIARCSGRLVANDEGVDINVRDDDGSEQGKDCGLTCS